MSDDSKAQLEAALTNHLIDQQWLDEGELVSEYVLIIAALPAERTEDHDSTLYVITADGMPRHHGIGLAYSYIHRQ